MHGLIGDRFLKRFADILKSTAEKNRLQTQDLEPGSDVTTEGEPDNPELGESIPSQTSKNLSPGEKERPLDETSDTDK